MKRALIVFLLGYFIIGCATPNAPRYAVSMDNSQALKKIEGSKVQIASIKSAVRYNSSCRMFGQINPPDGMTMSKYVEKAFNDELKNAGIYDANKGVSLSGVLTRAEFSSTSAITRGWWSMGLKLSSPGGKSINVENIYEFESGYEGMTACYQTAQALGPAVQDLINKIVTDPNFAALLK
jgi:hypothetical protein